jgi:hypothetical protein
MTLPLQPPCPPTTTTFLQPPTTNPKPPNTSTLQPPNQYLYESDSALASRKVIECSSYQTTPNCSAPQSPRAETRSLPKVVPLNERLDDGPGGNLGSSKEKDSEDEKIEVQGLEIKKGKTSVLLGLDECIRQAHEREKGGEMTGLGKVVNR